MTSNDLQCGTVFYDPQDLKQYMPKRQMKSYRSTTKAQKPKVLARMQRRSTIIAEAPAEILGLLCAYTCEAVIRGEILSIHIGGRILVLTGELERLLGLEDLSW